MIGWIVFGVVVYVFSHIVVYREGRIHGRQEILDELEAMKRQLIYHEDAHQESP